MDSQDFYQMGIMCVAATYAATLMAQATRWLSPVRSNLKHVNQTLDFWNGTPKAGNSSFIISAFVAAYYLATIALVVSTSWIGLFFRLTDFFIKLTRQNLALSTPASVYIFRMEQIFLTRAEVLLCKFMIARITLGRPLSFTELSVFAESYGCTGEELMTLLPSEERSEVSRTILEADPLYSAS